MKNLILKNWEAKLVALLAASILWFLIKKQTIDTTSINPKTKNTTPTSHVIRKAP